MGLTLLLGHTTLCQTGCCRAPNSVTPSARRKAHAVWRDTLDEQRCCSRNTVLATPKSKQRDRNEKSKWNEWGLTMTAALRRLKPREYWLAVDDARSCDRTLKGVDGKSRDWI